jgi:hypothetical protein
LILSHRYKFIFVKTTKTAGTSIEIALSRYCGPRDIVTPISLEDEPLRGQYGVRPRNYLGSAGDLSAVASALWRVCSKVELARRDTVPFRVARALSNWRSPQAIREAGGYYNHMPASAIRALCGEEVWRSYFKFCVEREPLDKTISHFCYLDDFASIDEYIDAGRFCRDFDKYTIDGALVMDEVIDFADLAGGLGAVCARLGIPFDGRLPRAKSGTRRSNITVGQLNERQREAIRANFRPETELLGSRLAQRQPG